MEKRKNYMVGLTPRGPAANWYGRAVASHARAADDPSPCSRPAPPCRSCGNPDNAGALHQLSAAVLSSPPLAVVAWPRLVSTKKKLTSVFTQ